MHMSILDDFLIIMRSSITQSNRNIRRKKKTVVLWTYDTFDEGINFDNKTALDDIKEQFIV